MGVFSKGSLGLEKTNNGSNGGDWAYIGWWPGRKNENPG
jgi:hypothetical protein